MTCKIAQLLHFSPNSTLVLYYVVSQEGCNYLKIKLGGNI